jgi:hypothetical protein
VAEPYLPVGAAVVAELVEFQYRFAALVWLHRTEPRVFAQVSPGESVPGSSRSLWGFKSACGGESYKWAADISDTLALGVLNEMLGTDVPILAARYVRSDHH